MVIRSLQGAEGLVKGFETRLSQEDTIAADPTAIQSQQDLLQVGAFIPLLWSYL